MNENSVAFIKRFLILELKIDKPIDENMLERIIDLATQWKVDMIDPLSKEGCDKTYDYPDKECNEMADKFVGKITGQCDDERLVPNFEQLHKNLGLF